MHKLSITIDLAKLKKERIHVRTYTNGVGETVTVKEYRMEAVPVREEKILKSGETYDLVKTHFITEATTKEEREAGYKGAILGDGLYFRGKEAPAPEPAQEVAGEYDYPEEDLNPEDIPF